MRKSSVKPDDGKKKGSKPEEKSRSKSPSAKRFDDLDRDEDELPKKKGKRRKSKFKGSKVGIADSPPSPLSEQKARRQPKSSTDDELSSLPKEINLEYFEQLAGNMQRAGELLDEHARGMVWQAAEVISCIPEYIPPRRYTAKLCRCNTCCERCCVDPEHQLTGFHSNFKDAATDVPDEEGLTLSGSSDTSGLSVLGDISDVGDDGKPRVSSRLAVAAREAKRAMRLARQFRSAARTMDSLECSNDSEQNMRRLYTKELMDKAVFYATKANEALAAYGALRRTLRRAADVSGTDDVTRSSLSASKLSHELRKTGFAKPEAASMPASLLGSRRQSVSKEKDSMPEDKGDKEAPAVKMSKETLFSQLRESLEPSAIQTGAADKGASGGRIVVKIKPLPVPTSSKKVGTRCEPRDTALLCEEFDFDTCASGSRDPKEIQKIIDEGVGTPKYTKDTKGATPDKKRPEIIYELSEQSLDIEIIPSQKCKETQVSVPFDEPLTKVTSQRCKEAQMSVPCDEPLSKASSSVTSPEKNVAKDASVERKLSTTGAEDNEGKGTKGDLPGQDKNVQKQTHNHKQHRQGSKHITAEKELPATAQEATEGIRLRKPSANVKTSDNNRKARNLDSGATSKAEKVAERASKKTSEDKDQADSHGGGSRAHLKVLPSDTYVFTATAAVIAGGDANNPTAMLAAPEDDNPKSKGKKPDTAEDAKLPSRSNHENANEAGTKKRHSSSHKHPKAPSKGSPENTKDEPKPAGMPEQAEKEVGEKPSESRRNRDGGEERATDKHESERKHRTSKDQEDADQKVSDHKASMKKYEDKQAEMFDQPEAGSKRRASKDQEAADQKVSDRNAYMMKYEDQKGEMFYHPEAESKRGTSKGKEAADQKVSDRNASMKKYEDKQGEMFDQPQAESKREASKEQEVADQKVSKRKISPKKESGKQGDMLDQPEGTGEKAKDELKSEQAILKEGYEGTDQKKSSEQAQASAIKTMRPLSADAFKDGGNKTDDKLKPLEGPQNADVIKPADQPLADDANTPTKPRASTEEKMEARCDNCEEVLKTPGVPESSSLYSGEESRTKEIPEDTPKPEDPQGTPTADVTSALRDSGTDKNKEGTQIAASQEESKPEPPQERESVDNLGDVGNQDAANMRADSIRDYPSPSITTAPSDADKENTQQYDVGRKEGTQTSMEFIVPKALAFGAVGDDWIAQTPNLIEPNESTEGSKDLKNADSSAGEKETVEATASEGNDGELEMHEPQEDIAEDILSPEESPPEESPPDLQLEEGQAEGDLLDQEAEELSEPVVYEPAIDEEDGEIERKKEAKPALEVQQGADLQQHVIELQNVDFELQSRPHARLRGPDLQDFNFWDLDGPAVFYPESRLVFAVALVASVWILYLLFQTRMNTNRKPFFELYTAFATGPGVPGARIMTEPVAVNDFLSREEDRTEARIISPSEPRFLYSCDTPYCKQEASYLSQVLGDDPCVNFYGYVCNKQTRNWNPMIGSSISADAFIVNEAAKLTTGYIFNKEHAGMKTARNLLEACLDHERDETWSRTELNELFFDYFGSSWPTENAFLTMEAVWVVAGRLARDLKLEALARVSVDVHPEDNSATVPSIGEPVLLYRRDDFSEPEYPEMLESAAEQTATFMNPAASGRQIASEVRKTSELLADMISNDSARSFGTQGYRLSTVRVLEPNVQTFLRTVFLDSRRVADNAPILVKSPQFLENLGGTKGSKLDPQAVLNYIGFRVMVYFAAFLPQPSVRRLRALEANFMLPENASVQDFCTREIERVFPAIHARAFVLQIRNFSASVKLRSSELKSKFIQALEELTWIAAPGATPAPVQDSDAGVARRKLESLTVEDAVPSWVLNNSSFEQYTQSLERQLEVALNLDPSNSLKRFCLFAKLLSHSELHEALLEGPSANRTALSVFGTETSYDAQKKRISVPLAVVDWSVPADSIAFVIHAARYAVRVLKALVRGLLPDYEYASNQSVGGRSYSEGYRERLRATVRCLLGQYQNASKTVKGEFFQRVMNHAPAGTALLEQSVALMQAHSVFKDHLRARRVWHSDFRLAGLPRLTSEQLFFVAYARDNCEASDQVHQRRRWLDHGLLPPEDRVNFPLAQFDAFARAFTCNHTAPMAANGHCALIRASRDADHRVAK
ncbi:hypothetical protein V5799_000854 [Amblyomma americanum]|uniref:Peptidase M13 C-terminal domain-containing protein n=1 Tax=Amblyomma americanum TaxID=6943 RepID=A0AAQ4D1T2_AMBAM